MKCCAELFFADSAGGEASELNGDFGGGSVLGPNVSGLAAAEAHQESPSP